MNLTRTLLVAAALSTTAAIGFAQTPQAAKPAVATAPAGKHVARHATKHAAVSKTMHAKAHRTSHTARTAKAAHAPMK